MVLKLISIYFNIIICDYFIFPSNNFLNESFFILYQGNFLSHMDPCSTNYNDTLHVRDTESSPEDRPQSGVFVLCICIQVLVYLKIKTKLFELSLSMEHVCIRSSLWLEKIGRF